jgi:hypothetical protein
MKGRILIGVALATYLAVVGCVVWPSGSAAVRTGDGQESADAHLPRAKLEGLPLRGVAVQLQDVHQMEPYLKALDEIAAVGADTVEFVVSARMENAGNSRIFIDQRYCPSPAQLKELIARAKQDKLRVMLMPIVLLEAPRGNEWRGTIKPEIEGRSAWDEWFDSYRDLQRHFATIAQETGVDLYVVGSELVSTESHSAEWTKTIRMVRSIYHGMLTYSSNWDHYIDIPFWDQLDIIGMNSYWEMAKKGSPASVEEVVGRWREIQKDLMAFSNRKGKPILLVEVGWCSMANATYEPWDYTKLDVPLDLDLQRRLYEAFFRAWYGNPNFAGFMIWEWEPFAPGGPTNRSYTPKGKPAEKVLRDWLAKGPWEVK